MCLPAPVPRCPHRELASPLLTGALLQRATMADRGGFLNSIPPIKFPQNMEDILKEPVTLILAVFAGICLSLLMFYPSSGGGAQQAAEAKKKSRGKR